MKRASILFCILLFVSIVNFYSYSQTKKPVAKTAGKSIAKTTLSTTKGTSSKAEIEEGKNLISKSDCLACHQLQTKVVGPAYSSVAEKYQPTGENVTKLADKIIKGGSGVWGAVPMTPHPTLAVEDAKKMVKYVLSLKSK